LTGPARPGLRAEAAALERLLADLVAIDSVNPDLVPGAIGEGTLARWVADWLARAGVEASLAPVPTPGDGAATLDRPNVYAVARGRGDGRSLLLNAHLDTVGVAGMTDPHAPRVAGGRLYGRGAMDTKGGLAAAMLAMVGAARLGLAGDVVFTAVVDEEYASAGTEALVRGWESHAAGRRSDFGRPDAAIVLEPTGLVLTTAHKGFVWLEVETEGLAAHGSLPEVGVDAIAKMGPILAGIDALAGQLARGPRHPLLGPGSIHASQIEGGQEWSSYPARCRVRVERRIVPGETGTTAEAELRRLVEHAAAGNPALRATVRVVFERAPLDVPATAPIVEVMSRHTAAVTGREARLGGLAGWTDAALLSAAGVPSLVFGPSGQGLHGIEEWVDLDSVRQCHEVLLATAIEFCG
jgi:acetylornithine deacetylase